MIEFIRRIQKKNIIYVCIGYADTFLNVALTLLLMRYLSTNEFGKISIGRSIFQSFEFSHLGMRDSFDRYLPTVHSSQERSSIFGVGLVFTILTSCVFVLFWTIYDLDHILINCFFLISGLLYAILQLRRAFYRSYDNKEKFIKLSSISILLPSVLQISLFYIFGIWGLLWGFLSAYIFIYAFTTNAFKIVYTFNYSIFKPIFLKLFKTGFVIFLRSLVSFAAMTGDRFLISKYWGFEMVGKFSIIMFVFSIFSLFPVNYTELIMNKLVKNMSLKYTLRHMVTLLVIMFVCSSLAYYILPYVLQVFIPKYFALYPQMTLLFWAILPASVRPLLSYYLIGIDKKYHLFIIEFVTSLLYLASVWYFLPRSLNFDDLLLIKVSYYIVNTFLILFLAIVVNRKQMRYQPS